MTDPGRPRRTAQTEILAMLQHGPASTLQLCERIGFGRASISFACACLEDRRLIVRGGRDLDDLSFVWTLAKK